MPPSVRPTRPTEPLSGIGGYIEFRWPGAYFVEDREPERIEVLRWEIQRQFRNKELAMSGGYGSLQNRRVADGFRFTILVDLDLTPMRKAGVVPGPGPSTQPHIDGRMEGAPDDNFLIAIHFQAGDPTFYSQPNIQTIARPPAAGRLGVYYFCPEVLLGEVVVVNISRGDVVTYRITGVGSAPLRRYVDARWCGAGALGIAQADQQPAGPDDAF